MVPVVALREAMAAGVEFDAYSANTPVCSARNLFTEGKAAPIGQSTGYYLAGAPTAWPRALPYLDLL
jgi:hypothetical protein